MGRRLEGPLHALWHARRPGLSATPCSWRSFTKTGRSSRTGTSNSPSPGSGLRGSKLRPAPQSKEAPPRAAPRQRVELPPDILADKYLRQARAAGAGQGLPGGPSQALEKLLALQQEHGLEPDPEDHFRYARIWSEAGAPERAMEEAVRYLQIRGREAEHYEEALEPDQPRRG